MKTLTRFAARDTEAFMAAIPFKSNEKSLSGKTAAAIALSMVALRDSNAKFNDAIAAIAEKVKPKGYDKKAAERAKALREAFPEGTAFDAEKWADLCPDKEFEETYERVNREFQSAVTEIGNEEVEVDLRLTAEHLSDIADVLVAEDTVTVNDSAVPVQGFLFMLASLI